MLERFYLCKNCLVAGMYFNLAHQQWCIASPSECEVIGEGSAAGWRATVKDPRALRIELVRRAEGVCRGRWCVVSFVSLDSTPYILYIYTSSQTIHLPDATTYTSCIILSDWCVLCTKNCVLELPTVHVLYAFLPDSKFSVQYVFFQFLAWTSQFPCMLISPHWKVLES